MDKTLLKRATEDTEEPTPGYMFRDIAQWTFLDQATQSKLIQYLMDKLKPTASVHVLAKTLRIIKILCETGHTDFQKEMQKKSDELKQYASYRGKPDPKYGDKLNEKVRTTAKEAIDAAFTHRREVKSQIGQGVGSDTTFEEKKSTGSFTTGNTVSAATTASGHANIAPMPTTNKWAEHMAKHGQGESTGGIMSSTFVKDVALAAKTGFGLWQENVKTDEQRMFEAMNSGSDFRPVEVGGFGSGGFGQQSSAASSTAGGGSWKFAEDSSETSGGASGFGLPKEGQSKILTPFQMEAERIAAYKATPQRVDLTQFVTNCEQIGATGGNWDDLTQALDERLQQKYNWQQRLNVLAAIEALLRAKTVPTDVAEYFTENPEDIQRNVHVVQTTLKEKAAKVLQILNIPIRTAQTMETSAAQNLSLPSVSGGGTTWASSGVPSGGSTTHTTGTAAQLQVEESGGGVDFGGLEVKQKARAEKPAEDKTKLKKRAAMNVAAYEEACNETPASAASSAPVVSSAPTSWGSDGWGVDSTKKSSSAGAWDGGFSASSAPAQPPAQQAPQQRQQTGGFDDFDSFFTASKPPVPVTPITAPPPLQQQLTPLSVQQVAGTSSPAMLSPSGSAQGMVAPPPSPSVAGNPTMMILQMQQQLQSMMSSINLSDPSAAAQMQMMMQQQQQLMALIAAQSHLAANGTSQPPPMMPSLLQPVAPAPAVVPHGSFQMQLPPQRERSNSQNQALAAVQQEMMNQMLASRPHQ
jgi:hypothetical protein